jgi:hypothetical protein
MWMEMNDMIAVSGEWMRQGGGSGRQFGGGGGWRDFSRGSLSGREQVAGLETGCAMCHKSNVDGPPLSSPPFTFHCSHILRKRKGSVSKAPIRTCRLKTPHSGCYTGK